MSLSAENLAISDRFDDLRYSVVGRSAPTLSEEPPDIQEVRPFEIRIRLSGQPPKWLGDTLRAFDKVLALAEGWDSYDARCIQVNAVVHALTFLIEHSAPINTPPQVVPTSNGGVQLEWNLARWTAEFEFDEAGLLGALLIDNENQKEIEVEREQVLGQIPLDFLKIWGAT